MPELVFLVDPNSNGHHGTLCIRASYVECYEPIRHVSYWPLHTGLRFDRDVFDLFPELESGQVPVNACFASFLFYFTRQNGHRIELRLVDTGRTKPIKTTLEKIDPPKSRLPLRWHAGHWQKLTKRDGWTYA